MRLKFVLAEKENRGSDEIPSIATTATIKEVAEKLCELEIGAMLVHDPGSSPLKYVGVISERDILRLCSSGHGFLDTPAADVMTRQMVVAKTSDDVDYVTTIMRKKHIRHVPVVTETDDPIIVGFLSIRDILSAEVDEQTVQIHHLSDFLGGTYGSDVY